MRRSACSARRSALSFSSLRSTAGDPAGPETWESWLMYGEEFRRCPLRNGAKQRACVRLCLARAHARCGVIGRRRVSAELAHLCRELGGDCPATASTGPKTCESTAIPRRSSSAQGCRSCAGSRRSHDQRQLHLGTSARIAAARADDGAGRSEYRRQAIAPVEFREGRLWLGAVRTVTVPRALQVQVYRLLQDDIPLRLVRVCSSRSRATRARKCWRACCPTARPMATAAICRCGSSRTDGCACRFAPASTS